MINRNYARWCYYHERSEAVYYGIYQVVQTMRLTPAQYRDWPLCRFRPHSSARGAVATVLGLFVDDADSLEYHEQLGGNGHISPAQRHLHPIFRRPVRGAQLGLRRWMELLVRVCDADRRGSFCGKYPAQLLGHPGSYSSLDHHNSTCDTRTKHFCCEYLRRGGVLVC